MRKLLSEWLAGVPAAIIVMMAVVVALMCNCAQDDDGINKAGFSVKAYRSPAETGMIFFESEHPETGKIYTGSLYTIEHPHGQTKIMAASKGDRVVIEVITMNELGDGFELTPARCKQIETLEIVTEELAESGPWEVGDTIRVDVTVLIYEQPTSNPEYESFAAIRYTAFDNVKWTIQVEKMLYGADPWEYWYSDPDCFAGFIGFEILPDESLGRRMWNQSWRPHSWVMYHLPEKSPPFDPPEGDPDGLDWKAWIKCTAQGTAWGCATASAACLMSPEPYDDCVGAGCRQGAIASALSCAISQLVADR